MISLSPRAAALALIPLVAPLAACDDDDSPLAPEQPGTIVEVAGEAGIFNTLITAVTAADLAETLGGPGPFTVFAPTDAAFAALEDGVLDALLADTDLLTEVLLYHVVGRNVPSTEVAGSAFIETLNGQSIPISTEGGVSIGGAGLVSPDVEASNGTIHIIDEVLIPTFDNVVDALVADGRFGTLVTAVGAANLAETLSGPGPFTIFAPTDAAFAAVPADALNALLADQTELARVLTFHVASGRVLSPTVLGLDSAPVLSGNTVDIEVLEGSVFVEGAQVIQTDIQTTNGVIHVIDAVIFPPAGG